MTRHHYLVACTNTHKTEQVGEDRLTVGADGYGTSRSFLPCVYIQCGGGSTHARIAHTVPQKKKQTNTIWLRDGIRCIYQHNWICTGGTKGRHGLPSSATAALCLCVTGWCFRSNNTALIALARLLWTMNLSICTLTQKKNCFLNYTYLLIVKQSTICNFKV